MGASIDIYKDVLITKISELNTLADATDIQEKINEIDGILSLSCGNSVAELKSINDQLQTIQNSMETLISSTADMLQVVLDNFVNADESAAADVQN